MSLLFCGLHCAMTGRDARQVVTVTLSRYHTTRVPPRYLLADTGSRLLHMAASSDANHFINNPGSRLQRRQFALQYSETSRIDSPPTPKINE